MDERIKQIIDYYGLNTSQFEKKIFASNGSIRTFLNRKSGLNATTIVKILENCYDISPDWLLLGRGEMLRQTSPKQAAVDVILLDRYEKKVEECALLKAELNAVKERAAKNAEERGAYSGTAIPAES